MRIGGIKQLLAAILTMAAGCAILLMEPLKERLGFTVEKRVDALERAFGLVIVLPPDSSFLPSPWRDEFFSAKAVPITKKCSLPYPPDTPRESSPVSCPDRGGTGDVCGRHGLCGLVPSRKNHHHSRQTNTES
jgi:hypothetical protein